MQGRKMQDRKMQDRKMQDRKIWIGDFRSLPPMAKAMIKTSALNEHGHLRWRAHDFVFRADGRESDGVSESFGY